MHENEYAYGVARVRANEINLLSQAETEQLITADNYDSALRILADKGWKAQDHSHDYAPMLEERIEAAWQLLKESAPDISLLNALVIFNDFYNLKAALKAKFSNLPPENYVTAPSVYDSAEIIDCVVTNSLDDLPECMRECANTAYDAIVRLESGRLADTAIDAAALKTRLELAQKSGSELLKKLSELTVAVSDIKTAVRSAAAGRDTDYIKKAVCGSSLFNTDDMISAAMNGASALAEFLRATELSDLADSLEQSLTAFEKQSDNKAGELIKSAKYTAFGPDPLVAYYIACETEVKNVRVILSAKLNGFSADLIRERVRETYA